VSKPVNTMLAKSQRSAIIGKSDQDTLVLFFKMVGCNPIEDSAGLTGHLDLQVIILRFGVKTGRCIERELSAELVEVIVCHNLFVRFLL
jgi:hypothetical protein